MNTKLGKDIFLEILDAYQKKNITQQEFYTLLNEKETVVISPILSILEMGEFDNREQFFNSLLKTEYIHRVLKVLKKFPSYRKDLERRDFLLTHSFLKVYDFQVLLDDRVFYNPLFLKSYEKGAVSISKDIAVFLEQNPTFLDFEEYHPIFSKMLLMNKTSYYQFLPCLQIPEILQNKKFLFHLAEFYYLGGNSSLNVSSVLESLSKNPSCTLVDFIDSLNLKFEIKDQQEREGEILGTFQYLFSLPEDFYETSSKEFILFVTKIQSGRNFSQDTLKRVYQLKNDDQGRMQLLRYFEKIAAFTHPFLLLGLEEGIIQEKDLMEIISFPFRTVSDTVHFIAESAYQKNREDLYSTFFPYFSKEFSTDFCTYLDTHELLEEDLLKIKQIVQEGHYVFDGEKFLLDTSSFLSNSSEEVLKSEEMKSEKVKKIGLVQKVKNLFQ